MNQTVALWLTLLVGVMPNWLARAEYPERPIKLIVPFGPGGGSDTFARAIKKAIDDHQLLPQPLVIVNVGGAGATIGSRQAKNAEPDGYTILLLHEAIVTARYAGQAEYGSEAFEPVAGTGRIGLVVAVAEKSPYHSLNELMQAAQRRPDQLVFSANIGAPVHFVGAMLEQHAPGARFRFTQTGSGEKRLHALLGRHADVSAFSIEEFLRYKPAGIRALAYLDKQRHPAEPDVPTSFEQGIPVQHINMQFWWAPKGTPREHLDVLAEALRRAMQTGEMRERMAKIYCDPVFLARDEMLAEIAERQQAVSRIKLRETQELPNTPLFVGGVVLALGTVVALQSLRQGRRQPFAASVTTRFSRQATAWVCVATVAYVLLLSLVGNCFRPATFLYLLATGLILTRGDRRHVLPLLVIAGVMSFGLHYLLTQFFSLVLP